MSNQRRLQVVVGLVLFALGIILVLFVMVEEPSQVIAYLAVGAFAIALGVVVLGLAQIRGKVLDAEWDLAQSTFHYVKETVALEEQLQPRELDTQTREERQRFADQKAAERSLPGENAPRFSLVSQSSAADLLVRPSAYPMTPMYMLDRDYRVIDWNEAFSLAFDRTMEGRRGRSVLEWTYFLDNYEQVLSHGMEVFGDPDRLPAIDVEPITYTSTRYGSITAVKRAYQIPDDDSSPLAWLITIDLEFGSADITERFQEDLQRILGLDQLWSEYAFSYDKVLSNSRVYNELLGSLVGDHEGLAPLRNGARILDLGAGTGNLSLRVMQQAPDSLIVALDNNRTMLDMMRVKCKRHLRRDDNGPGIIVSKQDVSSLFGLDDNSFDYVLANNVFYAVADVQSCLREVARVLKPGGELRMSGPRTDTNLKVLFQQIRSDLEETGQFKRLAQDFKHVMQINELRLRPMLHRWTTEEFTELLLGKSVGFSSIVHRSQDVYAGQSMLVAAAK